MRADLFLAERYGSRTKAAQALSRGEVRKDGRALKPSDSVSEGDKLTFLTVQERYVSNGGYKLGRAFATFPVSAEGKVFADIGASTGGFTDCLLQHGAKRVYAIDVGESLLDESLADDPRIVRMEQTNARYLTKDEFPEPLDGVVIDVSFISLTHILPAAAAILPDGGEVLALIKPQFECGGKGIGKSGIVREEKTRLAAVERVFRFAEELSLIPQGLVNAPLQEKKNIEYVIWLKKGADERVPLYRILQSAENLR